MIFSGNRTAHFSQRIRHCISSFLHSFSQNDSICSSRNIFHTFIDHSLCKNSCCCCSVTCHIIGFCSNFFYNLSAHIFISVFQFNLLGNGNTIIGNQRCTILHLFSCINIKTNILCHNNILLSDSILRNNLFYNCNNIILTDDYIFFFAHFHIGSGVFGENNFISFFYLHLCLFAILITVK